MTTVYLIRHGESEGNLFRICQGHDEELLSLTGRAQAKALGARFRLLPIRAVYTSDLCRAAQTALPIAKPHHLPLIPSKALREICLGTLEGRSWGDVYHAVPELRVKPIQEVAIPGAESQNDVAARVLPFMDSIARKHDGESVCVVSHGGAISNFLARTFPEQRIDLAGNTAVCTLTYTNGAWNLVKAPETDHLTRAGIPEKPLFSPDSTDLRFENIDYARDEALIERIGHDSWQTVFGTLDDYRADLFCSNARRMARIPGLATLCMDGDNLAGMLLLDPDQGIPNAGHISLVYLEPEYRYRGLGMQLIGHALVVYRGMNRKSLQLHVAARNRSAIRFYQKCAFRFASLPVSGQLLMRKNIEIPKMF